MTKKDILEKSKNADKIFDPAELDISSINIIKYLKRILNEFAFCDYNPIIYIPSWAAIKIIEADDTIFARKMLYEWRYGIDIFNVKLRAYKADHEDTIILIDTNQHPYSKYYYCHFHYVNIM